MQKKKLGYIILFTIIGLTLVVGTNYFINYIPNQEAFNVDGREIILVRNPCNTIYASYSPQTDVIYRNVLKITEKDLQELPKLKDLLDVLESRFPVSPSSRHPSDDNGLTVQEFREYLIWFDNKTEFLSSTNRMILHDDHFYWISFQQCPYYQ